MFSEECAKACKTKAFQLRSQTLQHPVRARLKNDETWTAPLAGPHSALVCKVRFRKPKRSFLGTGEMNAPVRAIHGRFRSLDRGWGTARAHSKHTVEKSLESNGIRVRKHKQETIADEQARSCTGVQQVQSIRRGPRALTPTHDCCSAPCFGPRRTTTLVRTI